MSTESRSASFTCHAQQAWLEQLIHEFNYICSYYRVQLRTPIFELSAAKQQLGCWVPDQRIIRISQHLIASSCWDVVLMVLKHEMAHQVCSEYFGLPSAGHGKAFQDACQLLGVPAPYNRSTGDLPDVLAEPAKDEKTEAGRNIIRRVNKLLALAGSENEHEAALAMQRATQLLRRHNLEMTTAGDAGDAGDNPSGNPSGCVRLVIKTGKKQIPSWRKAVCRILNDYFFVEVIFSSLYDAQRQDSYRTIELLGRSENVPVAEHCYYFLEQQLESLWVKNRQRFKGNTRTAKNSYYLGLLHGFSQKMAEQGKQAQNISQGARPQGNEGSEMTGALIVSGDTVLQEFVGFHFPRLRTSTTRGVRIDRQSYEDAVIAGKKIVLHQSLTEKRQEGQPVFIGS
ncbi:MAG: DUF2786 domain-containing protein [Candidatus Electrothrix sp. Rat3]|nr:DUF2786 domain-containing protein [Candidatus Electrothrix rattekaaiensis]